MRLRSLCTLGLAFALSATSLFAASGFDINDVAVLFPNDAQHKPVPYVDLSESTLIRSEVLNAVLKKATELAIAAPQTASIAKPGDWSVRGFRIDPCAPELPGVAIDPCLFELRLVAQPIARFSPADSSLHLVYKIQNGKPSPTHPLLLDLLQLKRSAEAIAGTKTDGESLGTHPLLAAAAKAKSTEIPRIFAEFVRKYATSGRLSKVTMMGLRNGSPTDWIFFGGDVVDGKWVSTPVPNHSGLPSNFVELSVTEGTDSFKGKSQDERLALDSFFNAEPDSLPGKIASIAETVFSLENPQLSDRNTADCVSCHAATSTRLATDVQFPLSVPGISAEIPTGITAFPAMGAIQNHPLHWNLRAFGYFGLQPTVAMRTVHEAARSAAELNDILGLDAPGLDCRAKTDAVMQCLISGTVNMDVQATTAACLALCSAP